MPETTREGLGRALAILQVTQLPADLVDNPARTGQWLTTVGNLHQALLLLRRAHGRAEEGRAERLVRLFNRMIDGLPLACLTGLSPVTKLGLLWPLLADLDRLCRRFTATPMVAADAVPLQARLGLYGSLLATMAARHAAPDPPPLRPSQAAPAAH